MGLALYLNFDGNCKEALDFYARVFPQEVQGVMRFSDAPAAEGYAPAPEDRDRIMFSSLVIDGTTVIMSDVPSNYPMTVGNNVSLTFVTKDSVEATRVYEALKEGGKVVMEMGETFWSPQYGYLMDRFGISWQVSVDDGREY